jgi:hypothetical protein
LAIGANGIGTPVSARQAPATSASGNTLRIGSATTRRPPWPARTPSPIIGSTCSSAVSGWSTPALEVADRRREIVRIRDPWHEGECQYREGEAAGGAQLLGPLRPSSARAGAKARRPKHRRDAERAVRRSSAACHVAIALVILSGVINTVLSWELADRWSWAYQAMLDVEIALVAVVPRDGDGTCSDACS